MNIVKIALFSFSLICSYSFVDARFEKITHAFDMFKSGITFHITLLYGKLKYGHAFNYQLITGDSKKSEVTVCFDENNNILNLSDGKKTPLVLGSIIRKEKHIKWLQKSCGLSKDSHIAIYSLNQKFERNWAGLSNVIKKNCNLKLFKYPTIDFTVPSMVDLIRAIRDLANRDHAHCDLAYVHCKAGRGRSATVVTAYLIATLFDSDIIVTADQVQKYLKYKRSEVSLSKKQKDQVQLFEQELKKAGSFDALLLSYKNEVEKRDEEVIFL